MSSLRGRPVGIDVPIMGRATSRLPLWGGGQPLVYLARSERDLSRLSYRFLARRRLAAILTGPEVDQKAINGIPAVVDLPPEDLAELQDGDVLFIDPHGRVAVFYKVGSPHNCILATHRCNCLCVMCPQVPGEDPEDLWKHTLQLVNLLDPQETTCLAITGGEPTLLGEKLLELIRLCRQKVPNALITLLTNARKLKDLAYAREVVKAGYPALLMEVPLFGDTDTEHDEVMGAKGSFWDTIQALYNLALLEQPVGLRTVLHALTVPRLVPYAEFIYRNLPFVMQVAFMGMETRGLAEQNLERLWMDPYDYREKLAEAVRHLHRRLVPPSIYNHPLCVLAPETWPFARNTITTWKQLYPPLCAPCQRRAQCGGVFGTGVKMSAHLHPLS